MNYPQKFKELNLDCENHALYPRNDIGTARLFHDMHKGRIIYVEDAKFWLVYDGRCWRRDEGAVKRLAEAFVEDRAEYARQVQGESLVPNGETYLSFEAYAAGFQSLSRRKALIEGASTRSCMRLSEFDSNPYLFNCQNGTFDLERMEFRPHFPSDYITKVSRVEYSVNASCDRWERFIEEVMEGNSELALYLQKALGYALSGETSQDCFFLMYGPSTRNGKSTLIEATIHSMGDYAMSTQPQTFAKRNTNGSSPSPDLARLRGVRFVNVPEPEKGMELNSALVKQVTGGDRIMARYLFGNPFEYPPEFKIFINSNHIPRINDRTVVTSGRLKVIPFNRHFTLAEQDKTLKQTFKTADAVSGIFNWLAAGYQLFKQDGLADPAAVCKELDNFEREATADIDDFLNKNLVEADGERLKTSDIHQRHSEWAKANGYKPLSSQSLMRELRSRYEVKRFTTEGNAIPGYTLK